MLDEGLAASTNTKYKQAWKRFLNWYGKMGFKIMDGKNMQDCDESFWLMWLAWEWKFSTFSSIRIRIFALKHYFGLFFGFDPFTMNHNLTPVRYVRFEDHSISPR